MKRAGATGVTIFGLHLRGSTRGWFMTWLARTHPELVGAYRELYRRGAYLPPDYRAMLDRAKAMGYDTARIEKAPQQWPEVGEGSQTFTGECR